MISAILAIATALMVLAAAPVRAPQPVPLVLVEGGRALYPYDPGTQLPITCPDDGLTACDMALLPMRQGDYIEDIICPQSTKRNPEHGWIIRRGSAGPTKLIYLTPKPGARVTNLIVTTHRGMIYRAVLTPKPTLHTSYGYYIVVDRPAPRASAVPTASPVPTPTANVQCAGVAGKEPFSPVAIWCQGDLMYVQFPSGTYAFPDIAQLTDNELVPVPHTPPDASNTVVIQGIYETVVLYVGEGKHQRRVYVRRR